MASVLKSVSTITFGDVAENHARMQKIGHLHEHGYSVAKLRQLGDTLHSHGLCVEYINLHLFTLKTPMFKY